MKAITATAWAGFLLWAWASRASGSYYRATDYPLGCYATPQLVPAKNKIGCASRCTMTRCSYFRFLDGTCTLFDQGLASEAASRTYRKVNSTTLPDVALNKNASPSNHTDSYPSPDRAVDGDIETYFHSATNDNPWWSVDLGENYCIQLIDVLPIRYFPSWFHSVEIRAGVTPAAGDFSAYALVASFPGPHADDARLLFTPPGVQMARYISIQIKATSDYLAIQDVKVKALVIED